MLDKRGQIALFVIIAILLVVTIGLVAYFGGIIPLGVPAKIAPVEDRVLGCIDDVTSQGAVLLGDQGGYISLPDFEPGSEFAPFSSQFNFFGSVMPYWFYLSSNGEYKEQVPTLKEIEEQLEDYIEETMQDCDVRDLEAEGYVINFGEPSNVEVIVKEEDIFVDVDWSVDIEFEDTTRRISSHEAKIKNNLGKLYELALNIYDAEQSKLFLEDYTVDILALYAPGTGVEFSCAPEIWSKDQVKADLLDAIQNNLAAVKISGDYYKIRDDEREYFVQDIGSNLKKEQVNILYDKVFPTKIEIEPSSGDVLRADPVGNQEGLGIIGFCYVPYHFIYDVQYPVIVQVFDEDFGLFQFPIIVSIENNQPRGTAIGEQPDVEGEKTEICEYAVQDYSIVTRDLTGARVDSDISFKCSGTVCHIGEADGGELETKLPQCVNGFIVAQKDGYVDAKVQVSTNEGGSAEIIMKEKHEIPLRILKDLKELDEEDSALITFSSDDISQSIFYPTMGSVTLAEGTYKVTAYLFKEGKIVLQEQSVERCIDVPKRGVLGFLGFVREDCFNINQPAQELTQITIGGGTGEVYFSDEDLRRAEFVGIEIGSQPIPTNVFELQDVYNSVFASTIGIILRT